MRTLFLVFLSLACAQSSQAQFLWKISGAGLDKSSYILGTVHVAPVAVCDNIKGFEQAFAECEQLYGEVNLNTESIADAREKGLLNNTLPPDSLLDTFYTRKEYRLIDKTLKKHLGEGVKHFKTVAPSDISMKLAIAISTKYFPGYDPEKLMDVALQERARNEGKTIGGLETFEFQAELISPPSLEMQARELLNMIGTLDELEKGFQKLSDIYLSQDFATMSAEIPSGEFIDKVIFERNRTWRDQLPAIMSEKPTFVVVGMGHLPGDQGMINLLREEGYTVEPVW